MQWRSEGWGITTFGKYDLPAIADAKAAQCPTVAIWGDSMIEAYQVNDEQKTAQQVTAIWRETYDDEILALGIGCSGRSIAEYDALMSRYDKVLAPSCHIILLATLLDICPDGKHFITAPQFKFVSLPPISSAPGLRKRLQTLRLGFLVHSITQHMESAKALRFRVGPVARDAGSEGAEHDATEILPKEAGDPPVEAWRWALRKLKQQTSRPIAILYSPNVPYLKDGKVIREDPSAAWAKAFAEVCREAGVGFIDQTERNVALFEETGRFTRGFYNGKPAYGHFNVDGHRLLAQSICDYIRANLHAVYSD